MGLPCDPGWTPRSYHAVADPGGPGAPPPRETPLPEPAHPTDDRPGRERPAQRRLQEDRRAVLGRARLCVLATEAVARGPWLAAVEAALRGGAGVVQLREKTLDDVEVARRAAVLRRLCDDHGALLVVNDRVAVARDAGADGVHLGQEDASVAEARGVLGSGALIGASTHDAAELDRALADGTDYVGVGSLYPTATKGRAVPVGSPTLLAPLARRAEAAGVPAFGIGGVDVARIGEVARAGFLRVAVSAGVLATPDPEAAARALVEALRGRDA